MTASYSERIYIAPQGYEDERIYCPAIGLNAEKVILLTHTGNEGDSRANRCQERVEEKLEEESIEIENFDCDIFDPIDALKAFMTCIRRIEPNADVIVNVSSGSKITAIAGMMACMFTEADPMYVRPEGYGSRETAEGRMGDSDAVSYGMKEMVDLPAYPVTEPDYEFIQVLAYISDNQPGSGIKGVIIKEIGGFLLENDFSAVETSNAEDPEKIYPLVNRKIIEPLYSQGLIDKQRFEKSIHIRTTRNGERMLELGRSLISDEGDVI
ncbi:DUF6293 family protein [Haladaptatus sp. R4]|uniref:HFX_2341 family transcriptional regulator domain-containing protein n=1 Tax=Haladaptatus sp. R4 TaxID=1679489 RepID=UPI00123779D8|nr:DUF6293 family protein [Haladaptatus sp. R4]